MTPKLSFPAKARAIASIQTGARVKLNGFDANGRPRIVSTPTYAKRGDVIELRDEASYRSLCCDEHPAAVLLDADGNEVPFVTPKPVIEQAAETFKSDWRALHQARHPNPHDPSLTDREAHRVVIATSNRERGG